MSLVQNVDGRMQLVYADGITDVSAQYPIAVDGDSVYSKDIDPDYSKAYLENILKSEKDNILKVIENIYPNEKYDYNISSSELFKKGEWFGAIINRRTNRFDSTDLYLIIMNKTDGKWSMVHYPEIVVTKTNFPDVPIEVLNSVNNLIRY